MEEQHAGKSSDNFDALRLLAAGMVVVSHMYAISGRPEPSCLPGQTLGSLAVLVFFAISGFLVTQSWQRDPSWPRFMARRLLRIWPAMAVVTLLGAFVLSPALTGKPIPLLLEDRQFLGYLKNLTLTPVYHTFDGFSGLRYASINGSPWTVPLEFSCYLILGLFGLFRLRVMVPAFLGVMLLALLYLGGDAGLRQLSHSPWLYLAQFSVFFFAGSLLALCPRFVTRWPPLLLAVAGALVCFLVGQTYLGSVLLVPLAAVRLGLASWPWVHRAGRYGDISYGIYLYAWPVQQWAVLSLGPQTSVAGLLACSMPLIVLLAGLSWFLVERPALSLKRFLGTATLAKPTGQR